MGRGGSKEFRRQAENGEEGADAESTGAPFTQMEFHAYTHRGPFLVTQRDRVTW